MLRVLVSAHIIHGDILAIIFIDISFNSYLYSLLHTSLADRSPASMPPSMYPDHRSAVSVPAK